MKFKKIKYHLLLWSMVLIFGVYVGISYFITSSTASVLPEHNIDNEEIVSPEDNIPNEDDYVPDTNGEGLPTDNYLKLINYALDIYDNGKGFTSTLDGSVIAKGSYGNIMSVVLEEHTTGVANRNQNEGLEEAYIEYKFNDPMNEMFKGYKYDTQLYRAVNTDKQYGTLTITKTREFNSAKKTYDLNHYTASKERYFLNKGMSNVVMLHSEEFYFDISENTVNLLTFDQRSSKMNYIIKVRYNIDKLPEEYLTYYTTMTPLPAYNYTDLTFEFHINKTTGKLKKIIRQEEFNGRYSMISDETKVCMKAKSTFTQTFSSMDKAAEVEKRYLEFPE